MSISREIEDLFLEEQTIKFDMSARHKYNMDTDDIHLRVVPGAVRSKATMSMRVKSRRM